MAYTNQKGEVVLSSARKIQKKNNTKSTVGSSFYFIGPSKFNYPLYIGYIIEEMGPKILVWILRRDTEEATECTIPKNIITYDTKNDNREYRLNYSADISRTKVQDKEKQESKSELKHV